MKRRLLELIVCPTCHAPLTVQPRIEDGGEIIEGSLACAGAHTFPIVNGVPRFVGSDQYADSFGFQWNKFAHVQLDSFTGKHESRDTFVEKTGFDLAEARGRLFLEAGSGAGRFVDVVSAHGGEIVGVDLSSAVNAAFASIGARPGVHIVQADIFSLPFRAETFDRIYSIGVLHHTPDTRRAFEALVPLLKAGGEIAIWVYDKYSPFRKVTDGIRLITRRLPKRVTLALSTIAVPLYYIPPLRTFFAGALRLSMHPKARWRWLDTFDWYSPEYQWKHTYPEVYEWFKAAGLQDIAPLSAQVSMKGRK
jgi:SAM-dependent methyltransferase